ncbi:hypothetical protein TNCV_2037041 [Trichonephila clavipes]|nr:hypothetical protein TNCV_2037041 [Trichonephila clavipes]
MSSIFVYAHQQKRERNERKNFGFRTTNRTAAVCIVFAEAVVLRFVPASSLRHPMTTLSFVDARPSALVNSLRTLLRVHVFRRLFSVLEFDSAPSKLVRLTTRIQ